MISVASATRSPQSITGTFAMMPSHAVHWVVRSVTQRRPGSGTATGPRGSASRRSRDLPLLDAPLRGAVGLARDPEGLTELAHPAVARDVALRNRTTLVKIWVIELLHYLRNYSRTTR